MNKQEMNERTMLELLIRKYPFSAGRILKQFDKKEAEESRVKHIYVKKCVNNQKHIFTKQDGSRSPTCLRCGSTKKVRD